MNSFNRCFVVVEVSFWVVGGLLKLNCSAIVDLHGFLHGFPPDSTVMDLFCLFSWICAAVFSGSGPGCSPSFVSDSGASAAPSGGGEGDGQGLVPVE